MDLAADAAHQNIVVVSHVSPIKASVAWALGTPDDTTWRLFSRSSVDLSYRYDLGLGSADRI